jgi:hypothetical protein
MRALAVWPWLKPAWYWFTNDDEAEREIRSGRMLVFLGGIPVSLVFPCLLAEWKRPRISIPSSHFDDFVLALLCASSSEHVVRDTARLHFFFSELPDLAT